MVCLTLQQAHEEAGERHGEDRLRAEVGQDGGEGCHGPPGCCRQQEDLLPSHPVDNQYKLEFINLIKSPIIIPLSLSQILSKKSDATWKRKHTY